MRTFLPPSDIIRVWKAASEFVQKQMQLHKVRPVITHAVQEFLSLSMLSLLLDKFTGWHYFCASLKYCSWFLPSGCWYSRTWHVHFLSEEDWCREQQIHRDSTTCLCPPGEVCSDSLPPLLKAAHLRYSWHRFKCACAYCRRVTQIRLQLLALPF